MFIMQHLLPFNTQIRYPPVIEKFQAGTFAVLKKVTRCHGENKESSFALSLSIYRPKVMVVNRFKITGFAERHKDSIYEKSEDPLEQGNSLFR